MLMTITRASISDSANQMGLSLFLSSRVRKTLISICILWKYIEPISDHRKDLNTKLMHHRDSISTHHFTYHNVHRE